MWVQSQRSMNVAATEHFHDIIDDIFSGTLVGGRAAIIARYSTTTVTYVSFEYLDVDPRRPAWHDLRKLPRDDRIEALVRIAQG